MGDARTRQEWKGRRSSRSQGSEEMQGERTKMQFLREGVGVVLLMRVEIGARIVGADLEFGGAGEMLVGDDILIVIRTGRSLWLDDGDRWVRVFLLRLLRGGGETREQRCFWPGGLLA